MTNISKSHQTFSNHLNNPRVLEYPQEFLGPNYKAVLDFWLFLDELTGDQWKTINGCNWSFYVNSESEWKKAASEAYIASKQTIGREFAYEAEKAAYWAADAAYWAAVNAAWVSNAADWATRELIGMHRILEQQKPLSFFNMFLDL